MLLSLKCYYSGAHAVILLLQKFVERLNNALLVTTHVHVWGSFNSLLHILGCVVP